MRDANSRSASGYRGWSPNHDSSAKRGIDLRNDTVLRCYVAVWRGPIGRNPLLVATDFPLIVFGDPLAVPGTDATITID